MWEQVKKKKAAKPVLTGGKSSNKLKKPDASNSLEAIESALEEADQEEAQEQSRSGCGCW